MIAATQRRFIVWLDSSLLVILLLLLSPRITGLALHEVLGFIFFIPIIIHLLIAWPWIQKATRKFLRAASTRTRVNFFLNSVLYLLIVTELVSGFIISQVVLPYFGINTINDSSWRAAHNLPLNFVVLFAGIHIAMNWGWIIAALKKSANRRKSTPILSVGPMSILMRVGILILVTLLVSMVLYSIIGQPSLARLHNQNEVARFRPFLSHGLVQLSGEAFLLAVVAFIARKWLRIRL